MYYTIQASKNNYYYNDNKLCYIYSGLSALNGHVVSGDVYAWAAVLILPVNSALNPFLYTFSAIIGQKVLKESIYPYTRILDTVIPNPSVNSQQYLLVYNVRHCVSRLKLTRT